MEYQDEDVGAIGIGMIKAVCEAADIQFADVLKAGESMMNVCMEIDDDMRLNFLACLLQVIMTADLADPDMRNGIVQSLRTTANILDGGGPDVQLVGIDGRMLS
jgi:hypothetical protein